LYLHLHRFLGEVLHRKKLLADPEPIRGHVGYAMVVANGRKMSTHLGNAISAGKLLRKYGADTLRLAVLWAGNPQRTLEWRPEHLTRAEKFLAEMRLFTRCTLPRLAEQEGPPATGEEPSSSRATITLQGFAGRSWERIGRFIDEDRPNAAIQELFDYFRRIQRYTAVRVDGRPLAGADRRILMEVLGDFAVTLSPFTPHLAEEFWEALGNAAFVCQAPWPPPGR
jgi:leucyl-tRNA synthetase